MIEVKNLHLAADKACDSCVKHINEHISAGLDFYIDMCNENDWYKEEFLNDECFAHLFPKGFTSNRLDEINRIRDLIESEDVVELTDSDKYILMHCLEDYYEGEENIKYTLEFAAQLFESNLIEKTLQELCKSDAVAKVLRLTGNTPYEKKALSVKIWPIEGIENRFYVMSRIAEFIHTTSDLSSDDGDFMNLLESYMSDIEDMSQWAELCFEDFDYELLGEVGNS
jgi:hypothetical protein